MAVYSNHSELENGVMTATRCRSILSLMSFLSILVFDSLF